MIRIRRQRKGTRGRDSGYMLLVLMLAVAVLTITMLGVARNYRRSIQRDREVEMIHRGEQYARAVSRFYHKYGRYPVSLEQLENMNNIRFLRKRYKDPMSVDGLWKLVHAPDVKLTGATGQASAVGTAGGANQGGAAGATQDPNAAVGPGTATDAQNQSGGSTTTGTATGTSSGTGGTSAFGNSNSAQGTSAFGSSGAANSGTAGANTLGAANAANGQVLGGGDVYGVVSKSKKIGIHSYGDKTKYADWFFIYVPAQDKGQLLVGPFNPKAFVGIAASGVQSGTGAPGSAAGSQIGGAAGTTINPGANSPGTATPTTPTSPTTTP